MGWAIKENYINVGGLVKPIVVLEMSLDKRDAHTHKKTVYPLNLLLLGSENTFYL